MSKIAVVGCQASGKTVFMAALADYYRPNQRVNQLCCMTPENANANRFSEVMIHQMRDLHEWPSATNAQRTMSLKWAMRRGSEIIAQIEMLDFGGEVFRAAFRDDEGTPQNQDAVRQLVDYLVDADFIVVLVSLAELSRDINRTATDRDVVLDAESKWVTRGLLDLLKEHQTVGSKVIVALTQADRPEHKRMLEAYGGPKGVFEKAWPIVSAVYPDVKVISVASVSNTTMDDRPAEGFKTDGVLSVMKEFSQHEFGDCDSISQKLAATAAHLQSMSAVSSPSAFTRKLNEFDALLSKLYKETAVIAELYKSDFQNYERLKATCLEFVNVIEEVERRPLESQVNDTFWREQEQLYPILAGTIRSFERYYQRKVEQQREEQRKAEEARQAELRRQQEAAAQAAAEHQRKLKQQEEDRQMRIKLESEAAARHKREMEEQERKDELERIRRRDAILAKKEEERIAAEKAKREEEEKRLRAERLSLELASKAKSFFVRMMAIGLVLAAIAGIAFYYYSDKQAKDRQKEIALYNARKDQEARIARENAAENARIAEANAKRQEEERKIAEARAAQARAESEAKVKQAEAERAAQEAEQLKQEAEREKARLEREAAEAKARAEEEKRRAAEEAAQRQRAKEAEDKRNAATREVDDLLDELRRAVSEDNLELAREKSVLLKRKSLTKYQKSVVKVCESFCERLEEAQNGNVESQMWIALQHASQKTLIKQDRAKAAEWYKKAADAGNSQAMLKLAYWAEDGKGCPKDDRKSIKWYAKAARAKNGDAMYRLGFFYSKGLMGLKRSPEKAYLMFKSAKDNGCTFKNVDEWLKVLPNTNPRGNKTYLWGGMNVELDMDDLLEEIEERAK